MKVLEEAKLRDIGTGIGIGSDSLEKKERTR